MLMCRLEKNPGENARHEHVPNVGYLIGGRSGMTVLSAVVLLVGAGVNHLGPRYCAGSQGVKNRDPWSSVKLVKT